MAKRNKMFGLSVNDGSTIYSHSIKELLSIMECEMEGMDEKEQVTFDITIKRMSDKEVEALPEWEG